MAPLSGLGCRMIAGLILQRRASPARRNVKYTARNRTLRASSTLSYVPNGRLRKGWTMRRVSVSLNDTLADALATYIEHRPDAPAAPDIMRTALCEYLAARGYVQSGQQPERRANDREDISPTASDDAAQDHTMQTIEAYIVASSAIPPTPPSVLDALRRYLTTMCVSVPKGPLRTPKFRTLEEGSGHSDTSAEHDRVLAELHQ